jgi:hypothetical protein
MDQVESRGQEDSALDSRRELKWVYRGVAYVGEEEHL